MFKNNYSIKPYHSVLWIDAIDVDLCSESDSWRLLWVLWTALNSQVVYASLIWSLNILFKKRIRTRIMLTLGGPKIIPDQWVNDISSSSSKPHEILPSRLPFCPSSNSSNNRKFRGIWTESKNVDLIKQNVNLCNQTNLLPFFQYNSNVKQKLRVVKNLKMI